MKIKISNSADMQTVATILFKNGYTVRQEKVKLGTKTVTLLVAEEQPTEWRMRDADGNV